MLQYAVTEEGHDSACAVVRFFQFTIVIKRGGCKQLELTADSPGGTVYYIGRTTIRLSVKRAGTLYPFTVPSTLQSLSPSSSSPRVNLISHGL